MSEPPSTHAAEIAQGDRFRFGANWTRFLGSLDADRIRTAEETVQTVFGATRLEGKRFLDVGCGSGLFSLAASRLGATVHSFDFDPASVACAEELRRRYPPPGTWSIERGSVLDPAYLEGLGRFDLVYSWGVLHHTGAMWAALENVLLPLAEDGLLCVALYNDQGVRSRLWRQVKRVYCKGGAVGRAGVLGVFFPWFLVSGAAIDLISRKNPVERYRTYRQDRGMSITHDWVDWLGGYPFEVATPGQVLDFYRERGWHVVRQKLTTEMGNNEFVFARDPRGATPD